MPLPRYGRTQLKPIGKGALRVRPQRQAAYQAVSRRCKARCELCTEFQDPLDPHHTFGRGHLAGIPAGYCETPELILGICHRCHHRIHEEGDLELADRARWLALERFDDRHGLRLPSTGDPVDDLRAMIRALQADLADLPEAG